MVEGRDGGKREGGGEKRRRDANEGDGPTIDQRMKRLSR